MSERTYETWQVVKALTEHADWKSKSPNTHQLPSMSIVRQLDLYTQYNAFVCYQLLAGQWGKCVTIERSDWRLYDSDENEVTDYE